MNFPEPPKKPSQTITELAKQRNCQAAQRTLTAWIQNSIKLMGLGIALDRISLNLLKAFPKTSLEESHKFAHIFGLSLIAFAIVILIIALWQYRLEIQALERNDYLFLSERPLIIVTTLAVVFFGFITALIIIFKI
ncbi:YidH family protein [Chroococcus sp. FPU101]|uniref:YidH family protein n=1 Tax=Chroococcus sp. FPU101 TaxID=1974212 RepID=UPI001A8C8F8D|nr:DUF202 domain-containing protein [Chroococcus sp. FPU101]GFE70854.1 hypothetical protein CFPU101_34640 [Chroococcus sp. FPU101]